MKYQSTKIVDGLSTCFRQHKAESHCRFFHGYALKFKLVFEASELDEKNWVKDFGFLKSQCKITKSDNFTWREWFKYMFDHTTIIAQNDPCKDEVFALARKGAAEVRLVDNVGCEAFAKIVFDSVSKMNDNRVFLKSVTCYENDKNSATYGR
jgi:6-pyruvoyltetrahydropterin/6-carboxytetrahydropterin synthase